MAREISCFHTPPIGPNWCQEVAVSFVLVVALPGKNF